MRNLVDETSYWAELMYRSTLKLGEIPDLMSEIKSTVDTDKKKCALLLKRVKKLISELEITPNTENVIGSIEDFIPDLVYQHRDLALLHDAGGSL